MYSPPTASSPVIANAGGSRRPCAAVGVVVCGGLVGRGGGRRRAAHGPPAVRRRHVHAASARLAAASADSTSSALTSRCVTARTCRGPRAPISTPCSAIAAQNAGASGTPKTTMFVVDLRRVGLDARQLGQALGEAARVRVVVREPVHVVVERVQAAGRHDPGLAQRAADHLLVAPRLVDELARPGEHGADRRAEALREVDPRGVEAGRPLARRDARRDDRVHEPRAVHVQPQAVLARGLDDRQQLLARPHVAAGEVRRLLDADEPRAGRVAVAGRAQRRAQGVRVEHAARPVDRAQHRARERGGPAGLGDDRVRRRVQVDLVAARPDVQPERDLVAHRPRGEEHRCLEPEQVGDPLAQRGHRRVAEALLVADLRLGHGAAHGGRGARLGVGVEVDDRPHVPGERPQQATVTDTRASTAVPALSVRTATRSLPPSVSPVVTDAVTPVVNVPFAPSTTAP